MPSCSKYFGARLMAGMGLLSGIGDPVFMAKLAEQNRIEKRLAVQLGITLREARQALYEFEACLCHDGHMLH
jgi:hypothetical protein